MNRRKTGLHLTPGPRAGVVQLPTGMFVSPLWNATLRHLTPHGHSSQSTNFELNGLSAEKPMGETNDGW